MKRIAAFVAAIMLLSSYALADIDLSTMTLEELNALKQQINLEIASRPEVKSVTVPVGVWEIGKDIPAGHWTMTVEDGHSSDFATIVYCSNLNETGKGADIMSKVFFHDYIKVPGSSAPVELTSLDLDMNAGMYLIINSCPVIFTPYSGEKPDLGFDW